MKKAITLALAALIATMALGLTAFAAGETATLESKSIASDATSVTIAYSLAGLPAVGVTTLSVEIPTFPTGFTLTAVENKSTTPDLLYRTGDVAFNPLTAPYRMNWSSGSGEAVMGAGGVMALVTFAIAPGTLTAGQTIEIPLVAIEFRDGTEETVKFVPEVTSATLTVTKTQAEIDADNKKAVEDKIDELLAIEDLDEDTTKALEDLKAELEDATSDQLADLADLFADVDADQITPEDLATLVEEAQKVFAEAEPSSSDDGSSSNAGGESSTNGGGSTNTGETTMIAAAIATVAIAGAAIVALKKRK